MSNKSSTMSHLNKLRSRKYLHEKVVYMLALLETEGSQRMLEVLGFYNHVELEMEGLVLYAAIASQIASHERTTESLATLKGFEERLIKIASNFREAFALGPELSHGSQASPR